MNIKTGQIKEIERKIKLTKLRIKNCYRKNGKVSARFYNILPRLEIKLDSLRNELKRINRYG